jgi:hypothetical protein
VKENIMKHRIATLVVLAAASLSAAYAADAPAPKLNELGSVKIMASPGDTIFAARNHRHEYIYVTHIADKSVDVIDVSNPSSPHQLTGNDAKRARGGALTAMVTSSETPGTARVYNVSDPNEPQVVAEFPNAISATSDNRHLIYVLDENSLRILSAPQKEQPAQDDSWFWNAMTPG